MSSAVVPHENRSLLAGSNDDHHRERVKRSNSVKSGMNNRSSNLLRNLSNSIAETSNFYPDFYLNLKLLNVNYKVK